MQLSLKEILANFTSMLAVKTATTSAAITYHGSRMYFWKQGDMVFFSLGGSLTNLPANGYHTVGAIPQGFEPRLPEVYYKQIAAKGSAAGSDIMLRFSSSGAIAIFNYSGAAYSGNGFFNGCYIGKANNNSGTYSVPTYTEPPVLPIETEVLAPNTNFAHYNDPDIMKIRKQGNVVNILGAYRNTAQLNIDPYGTNSYLMTTVPEGFRPPFTVNAICQGSGDSIWLCILDPNGNLYLSRYRVTSNTTTASTLAAGAWFPINITYITEQ